MATYTTLKGLFTAIADAIRGKDGSTAAIVADDFPNRISSIQTQDHTVEDALITGTVSGVYTNDRVTAISVGAFARDFDGTVRNPTLTEVHFPLVKEVYDYAFLDCIELQIVDMPNVIEIHPHAFRGTSSISNKVVFPLCMYVGTKAFAGSAVRCLYMRGGESFMARCGIYENAFETSSLTHLVISDTSGVSYLSNVNAFDGTPIASGTGYIYVPRALVDSYKTAENWLTYASMFRALEDYTVDGTTTGELDESKI